MKKFVAIAILATSAFSAHAADWKLLWTQVWTHQGVKVKEGLVYVDLSSEKTLVTRSGVEYTQINTKVNLDGKVSFGRAMVFPGQCDRFNNNLRSSMMTANADGSNAIVRDISLNGRGPADIWGAWLCAKWQWPQ